MNNSSNKTKYLSIVLVIVFFVTAFLLVRELLNKNGSEYNENGKLNGVFEYKGTEYVPRDNIETFLLIGLDRFDDQTVSHDEGVQADFLMMFVVNNETKQYTAVHINRDTMTSVDKLSVGGAAVVNTYTKQIALAYNYANVENDRIRCGNTKDSVEHLFHGINVKHYLAITMDAIPVMNDYVGGVEVELLADFSDVYEGYTEGKTVTLHGDQALTYIRARSSLKDSTNISRMKRQRQYIMALYEKTVSRVNADENFALSLVEKVGEYIAYDSSSEKLKNFVSKLDEYEFLGIREIGGQSVVGEEYMEFYPDDDSIWQILIDLMLEQK